MKNFIFILLLFSSFILIGQIKPSDNCVDAPRLCMNGLYSSTYGYKPGNEPTNCPNGSPWAVNNDSWIAFVPTQSFLELQVYLTGNCSFSEGVQALIHDNCASDPIDCDVDCSGSATVGAEVTFIPGKTYYLRIDGCSGAVCPFQISVYPTGAIEETNVNTGNSPPIGQITGENEYNCKNYLKTYTAPLINNIITYNWKITKGNAKILPKTSNYNDKNPSNPKTDVDIIGIDRNTIDIISLDTSDIHIEVRGITNCNITEKSSFDIKYKSINNDIKNITLCPNQKTYDDPFFKDDIITPNDTCGKIKTYNYLHVESIGCKYNVTLHVSKTCDTSTIRDLGTFNICKNSFFVMDNNIYKDTNFVYQTNPNFVINNEVSPPICKKELRFKLSELKPSKNILQNGNIYCNGDKITLYTPKIAFASNTKVAYQWEKRTSSGWVKIPNATKDTLLVDDAGTYRLFQDYKVQNVINQAIFTGEYCNMTFYSDTFTINQKAIIATPNIAAIGKKCIGNTITLSPTIPDVNLTYHWLDSDGNNSQNNEFNVSLSKNPLKVCLIANSNCGTNSGTICKDFIGVDSLKEKPSFSGIKQYCVGEPLILTIDNFDPNLKYSWIYPIDSMDIAVKNNTADFAAYFPGNYPITLFADNGCNELSSTNDFSFENQLSKSKIYGSSIVNEKTSQSYCIYTGQNNVTWKSSKGLKFKQSYKNGQSCISVSFPKISSSGWITATHSNSCSSITDSIYVIVKPVLFSNQLSKSNNIEAITEQHQDLEENQFKITPNPSNGNFSISSSLEFDKIEVMNIIGRAIYFDNSNNNQFNISEFPSGLYIVSLVKNGQKLGSKKLMKVD